MSSWVIDASVILAVFFKEHYNPDILPLLQNGVISSVNHSEVLTRSVESGKSMEEALYHFGQLPVSVVPFDIDHSAIAASLRMPSRHLGLSLGDRACIALGLCRNHPVLTAERSWAKLQIEALEVRLIR